MTTEMSDTNRWSQENAGKLDRVIQLLEGDGSDAPGLVARVGIIERVLFGKETEKGLMFRVSIMWRLHLWILCTLSAGAGFALREAVKLIWKI